MKYVLIAVLAICVVLSGFQTGLAAVKLDEAAPSFKLTDSNGKEHSLSDFKGKWVVLEWVNYGCPFVKKHYGSGNMQTLQKTYTEKGIVWLSICSSSEGKEGYFDADELKDKIKTANGSQTAYLVDEDGTVGKMYEAKTTPHMFIINPEGVLVYNGAIDNKRSTDQEDIKDATNYVKEALDAALAGKAIATKSTKPYGCSVKYK